MLQINPLVKTNLSYTRPPFFDALSPRLRRCTATPRAARGIARSYLEDRGDRARNSTGARGSVYSALPI
jgi:hypothetical protein